jgi:hypothetical protein
MEMQRIIEMLATNQAKLDADLEDRKREREERKSDREEIKQVIRAGQEQLQENLKKMMEEMMSANQANRDVKLEELGEALKITHVEREEPTSADRKACRDAMEVNLEKMELNPWETEAAVERQETPNEVVAIYSLRNYRKETIACQGKTEARLDSESEHREVPNEDAVVKPVRGRKKRHRGRKQAEGRRGEPEELTRGDCGFRKKLAAACRKVSRHATVAWRKRNIFRISWTQAICGPRQELAAGRNMTRRAGVARREGNLVREYSTRDNIAPKTRRGRTEENRRWKGQGCEKGIRSRDIVEPLHLRKGRKTVNSNGGLSRRQHPRLESMGNSIKVFGKTIALQFGKLADGSTVVLRKMRNWTLWRGRSPPKRKKSLLTKQEPVM